MAGDVENQRGRREVSPGGVHGCIAWPLARMPGLPGCSGCARLSSSPQFVDAQFCPQPTEVISRHLIAAVGSMVFERLEPIDDLGATLCSFYRGARRLVSKRRDWLIEQVPVVPVQTVMNDGAALLFGQVQLRRRRGTSRC